MEEKQNKDKINSDFVNRQILLTNSNNMLKTKKYMESIY